MDRDEATRIINKNFHILASDYGVSKIGFLGSITRNTMTPDSDIDVVVEFKRPIGFKFCHLVEYLEKIFGRKVDVLTKDGIQNIRSAEVAENIERELTYTLPNAY